MRNLFSNWKAFSYAICPFFVAIVTLWAMPRNARAQYLYVTSTPTSATWVTEYDAITGAMINPNVVARLPGFDDFGIVMPGNILFLANRIGFAGKYNATTGTAINASFIMGLCHPFGVASLDSNYDVGKVGEYNAVTGATSADVITGLIRPIGISIQGRPHH